MPKPPHPLSPRRSLGGILILFLAVCTIDLHALSLDPTQVKGERFLSTTPVKLGRLAVVAFDGNPDVPVRDAFVPSPANEFVRAAHELGDALHSALLARGTAAVRAQVSPMNLAGRSVWNIVHGSQKGMDLETRIKASSVVEPNETALIQAITQRQDACDTLLLITVERLVQSNQGTLSTYRLRFISAQGTDLAVYKMQTSVYGKYFKAEKQLAKIIDQNGYLIDLSSPKKTQRRN